MIKAITKIGNSQGIILDAALMDMAHLKVGDEVNISIHQGGSIVITPIHPHITPTAAAESVAHWIGMNKELFHRLSK
jgi:antitoxin component of MazEF toxin-antitoxin module